MPCGVERLVETVRIEVAERSETSETLVGLRDVVGPLRTVGETVAVRLTIPVKLKLVTVTMKVAVEPLTTFWDPGLAEIEKSGCLTTKVTPYECDGPQPEQEVPVANIVKVPVGVELVVETVSVDVA